MHQLSRVLCRTLFTPLPVLTGIFVCFFIRMTTRVGLAPPVAVCQTAPRPWPSPAASSRLPPATRTCHQVSDGRGASEALPPSCSENGHQQPQWGRTGPQSETKIRTYLHYRKILNFFNFLPLRML